MASGLRLRAEVTRLLANEGWPVTVRVRGTESYDPATGDATASTPTTFAGRGRVGDYLDKTIDGQNIQIGDRLCTFQPADWSDVPEIGNELIDGSDVYSIINVKLRKLVDPICYTMQLRGTTPNAE